MDITSFAWIVWLVLILVFIIIEMLSLDFVFLMIAIGSFGGLISGLFGVPWWGQLIIAAAVSVVLIFFIRPPLLHALKRGSDPYKSNIEGLIGMGGTVVETVSPSSGLVKLRIGETWTARLVHAHDAPPQLVPGDHIVVVSIEGATAVVAPAPVSAGTDGTTERSVP